MSSEIKADLIKDKSGTKTLATLSSSAVNLSTDVTVPATTSGCVKLYHNAFSGVTSASIDGYFDDTKYSYYELHLKNVRKASTNNNEEFIMRVNIGGSTSTASHFWTCSMGVYGDNGNPSSVFRADNDQANICNMDNTWSIPHNGNTAGSATYHLRIGEPQNTDRYKNIQFSHYTSRAGSSGSYRAILSHSMANVETTSALTGFTFFCASSGAFECTASLFGFRL